MIVCDKCGKDTSIEHIIIALPTIPYKEYEEWGNHPDAKASLHSLRGEG